MKASRSVSRPDLRTLFALIGHSPIVVPGRSVRAVPQLPAGYGGVELAILTWIAREARHLARRTARM